jgi:hypothetical protein
MKNADKLAFPIELNGFGQYAPEFHEGLTKREEFAARAMQGILSNSGGVIQANNMTGTGWCNSNAQDLANLAVECADALLKALEK